MNATEISSTPQKLTTRHAVVGATYHGSAKTPTNPRVILNVVDPDVGTWRREITLDDGTTVRKGAASKLWLSS